MGLGAVYWLWLPLIFITVCIVTVEKNKPKCLWVSSLFLKIFYLKTVVPVKIAVNHCNKMVFYVNGTRCKLCRRNELSTLLTSVEIKHAVDGGHVDVVECVCRWAAGGWCSTELASCLCWDQWGSSRLCSPHCQIRSWEECFARCSVCSRRSVDTGVCDVIILKVCCFFRYDHSRRSLQPAAGGLELLQKPFRSRVFHVFRPHPAHILGYAPQLH